MSDCITRLRSSGKPFLLPDGNVKREIVEVIIPRFKIGHTFDVNQTEGKPLVELSQQLTGELTDYQKELRDALLQISPVPVSFQPIEGSTNGFYSLDKNEITVDSLPVLRYCTAYTKLTFPL